MLEALASLVERAVHDAGADRQDRCLGKITEAIGSGPFKFVKEEWVPGNKAVFVKNTDYVPRKEAPSCAAGGKVAKVDRVEWLYIPDSATAAAALNAGEVDW